VTRAAARKRSKSPSYNGDRVWGVRRCPVLYARCVGETPSMDAKATEVFDSVTWADGARRRHRCKIKCKSKPPLGAEAAATTPGRTPAGTRLKAATAAACCHHAEPCSMLDSRRRGRPASTRSRALSGHGSAQHTRERVSNHSSRAPAAPWPEAPSARPPSGWCTPQWAAAAGPLGWGR